MRKLIGTAGLVAIVVTGACGGGSKTAAPAASVATAPPTTAAPDLATLRQRYLDATAPGNAAVTTFRQKVATLPNNASASDVAKVAAPLVTALRDADNRLLAIDWPASIRPDVDTMMRSVASLEGDLSSVGGQNVFSISAWERQVASDAAQEGTNADIVRRDLGLPPRQP